jgi:hypothetical protein
MSNLFTEHVKFCRSYNPANREDIAKLRAIVLPSLAAMRRDRVLNAAFLRHDKGTCNATRKEIQDRVRISRLEADMIKRTIEFANVRQYYKSGVINAQA